jgi:hypothetical protein
MGISPKCLSTIVSKSSVSVDISRTSWVREDNVQVSIVSLMELALWDGEEGACGFNLRCPKIPCHL